MIQYERSSGTREFLIGSIYRALFGATSISHALGELAAQTNSDKAFWANYDLQRKSGSIVDTYNVAPEFVQKYNSTLSTKNVWLRKTHYYQAEGLIWRGSKIASADEILGSPFHSEFLAPQQMFHTLHIVIVTSPEHVTHVQLSRPEYQPDFSEADIDLARCFAFHARQAIEGHRASAANGVIHAALTEVISDAALGVAIVDPPRVIYTSDRCNRILALLGESDRWAKGSPGHRNGLTRFPRAIVDVVNRRDDAPVKHLIINHANGPGRVLVSIKAFSCRMPTQVESSRLLVISFFDLSQRVPIDENLLQSAYDLTESEIRICSMLANDESVESVAAKLHITPNTARTHIKRIFSKTGAARQSELVKLMMNAATLRRNMTHSGASEDAAD